MEIPWNIVAYLSTAFIIIFLIYCAGVYILAIRKDKRMREKIFGLLTEYLTHREATEFMVEYVGIDWKVRPGLFWKEKMQGFLGYKDPEEPIEGVIVKILQIMKAILVAEKPEREAEEKEYESIKSVEETIGRQTG